MYKREYVTARGISLLERENEDGGFCSNGHYNIVPACTEMVAGKELRCIDCNEVYWKIIAIKVTETEIAEESLYSEKIQELYSKAVDLKLKILADCAETGSSYPLPNIEIDLIKNELIKMGHLY